MIWLPEPEVEDVSVRDTAESYMDWLRRNTTPRAKKSRAFLNQNIEELPEEWIAQPNGPKHELEYRWSSALFEVVCARVLQKLGASLAIEVEKKTREGATTQNKPDFTVRFSDCSVIVEATSTILDPNSRSNFRDHTDLINILKAQIPQGWSFIVWSLPPIGQSDSKREFQKVVADIVAGLPSSENAEPVYVTRALSAGDIGLELFPTEINGSWLAGPPHDSVDDAREKIAKAIHGKRRQTRQSSLPVILAINLDGLGPSYEDFDRVLFGYTIDRVHLRTTGFEANGLFTGRAGKEEPPTYAGILAFFNVGLWGWDADPILYINPHFDGKLPNELLVLETRRYDAENSKIVGVNSQRPNLKEEMLFASDAE